ncbi:MAG: CPBP family intramembrane metalloprotease [Bacteroidia bacterium]|nr:CPBP family intramembrane metalloprotease [Bacteroidia bacterium]MDW8346833.1 CPBP family intramembrane glutamic endopeptidase [Bacteroidia bacterium]
MNRKLQLPPVLLIIVGLLISIGMVIIFQSISIILAAPLFKIPAKDIISFAKNPQYIDATRFIQFFTQVGWFFVSTWLITKLYIEKPIEHFAIRLPQPYVVWILALSGILTIQVLVGWTAQVNAKIPLPDMLVRMEKDAETVTALFLKSENVWILWVNLFIIAIIPGIGEELFFRGFMQNTLLKAANYHIAIWITAIIFSAAHFQFMGFIPRMILGAYLGYLAYYAKSILPSILAHAFNNGMQVLMVYFNQDLLGMSVDDPKNQKFTLWEIFMSFALTVFTLIMVWYLTYRFSQNKFAKTTN